MPKACNPNCNAIAAPNRSDAAATPYAFQRPTITTAKALMREFKTIRRAGYSIDNEEFLQGVVCLAVPVRDNEIRVEYLGMSATRLIHLKLVISGVLAGLGGAVYGFSPALLQSAIGHYNLQFAVLPPLIIDESHVREAMEKLTLAARTFETATKKAEAAA